MVLLSGYRKGGFSHAFLRVKSVLQITRPTAGLTKMQNTLPTEAELEWLEHFLLNRNDQDHYQEGMDEGVICLSELDGFFAAIVSGPEPVMPSSWLPALWGDFEPEWQSKDEAEQAIELLIRFMNGVAAFFQHSPHDYEPMFEYREVDGREYTVVDEWCEGYMRGVNLNPRAWQLDDPEVNALIAPILAFTEQGDFVGHNAETIEDVESLQDEIYPGILLLHTYWLVRRNGGLPMRGGATADDAERLPEYSDGELDALDAGQLIDLMSADEDRVPRNVIDACANLGEAMLDALEPWTRTGGDADESDGEWWLRIHAVMILGLMSSERAGDLMMQFIKYLDRDRDGDLQDWLAGYWPALCKNKPTSTIRQFQRWCEDSSLDWYVRSNIAEAVLAAAQGNDDLSFEETLDWLAEMVANEEEDWDFRLSAANYLLDFPRQQDKAALEDLAMRQQGLGASFDSEDVAKAFREPRQKPAWERFKNPWEFYQPGAIAERQRRWREELSDEFPQSFDPTSLFADNPFQPGLQQPFMRDTPKVGRNDPCPCGSGRKFKKCCLH